MGKAQKKKKTQAWRHNPIRVPDSHLPAGKGEGSADPSKEKQTVPVLNKLKSPEYADRTWACAAICNLIQNDPATRRLFQAKNVVGELIERLSDDVDEVVVEASGALRNLAIDGGHELCAEMFNKGVMAHIVVLSQKISGTIDSVFATKPDTELTDEALQSRKHLLGLTENILSLIWSMGETSHKSLEALNAANVEGLLVKVLDGRAVLGPSVAVAAAQAMYSLSQDNFDFKRKMTNEPAALEVLAQVARDQVTVAKQEKKGKGKKGGHQEEQDLQMLLKLLVCGVLRNVVDSGSEADEQINIVAITNEVALPIINDLLNLDTTHTVARVFELVRDVPSQSVPQAGKELKTDHRSPAEVELESIERSLNTVVVGLEILTGICAGIEESDEVEEVEEPVEQDDEMDEDLEDEDLIAQGVDTTGTTSAAPGVSINTPVTLSHLLQTLSLPQRLSTLSSLTPLSFPPSSSTPSPHPPTTSLLSTIHLRALEALNNLLLTTVAGDAYAPGSIPSQGVWDTLFKSVEMIASESEVISAKGHEMRGEVLEMATGCLWGIVKLASDEINVAQSQVKLLIDVLPSLKSDGARTRVIETLALLASRQNVSNDENKAIGDFLISALSAPPPAALSPEILVSVLNAIIDIYADEERTYDSNFVGGGHLKSLSSQVNRVRNDMKKIDRRKDRELRARGEETYENLVAFIKYRRSLGR